MGIHLGYGSTKREMPKKAFEASNGLSGKINFGESTISQGQGYRKKGVKQKSWFWVIFKVIILGAILFGILFEVWDAWF